MDTRAVGQRIDQRQRHFGLTNRALAARLGCHESHLSRVKRGYVETLSYDTVREWASVLGVTPQWLIDGDELDLAEVIKRLSAEPDIGLALSQLASWQEASTEHDREKLRHILRRLGTLLSRRDTRLKEVSDRDLVEFEQRGDDESL